MEFEVSERHGAAPSTVWTGSRAERHEVRGPSGGDRGRPVDRGAGRPGRRRRGAAHGTPRHALALNLVIGRRVAEVAVGLRSSRLPSGDPGGSGGRFLFLAPQERSTLLGTWYAVADRTATIPPPALDRGAETLLAEFNRACPGLGLSPSDDVVGRQWGRLPLKAGLERGHPATLAERPRVGWPDGRGPANLLTVEAVKYTTARAVAAGCG